MDWTVVYHNLNKAQRRWGMITGVLAKTGAMVRARGLMYKVVAQSVLIYNSDSWVVAGAMLKVVEELHHWVARRITGMTETCGAGGEW